MRYVPQIDGLRFFAFLGVFLFHCNLIRWWFGAYGVHLFFTLSGFLITYLLLESELPDKVRTVGIFYGRRALRIFPAYYTAIALALPFGHLLFPEWQLVYLYNMRVFHESTLGIPSHLFNGWQSSGVHFWSLCVEEQFYLTYPWILLLVPKPRRVILLAALIVLSIASRAVLATLYPNTFYGLLLPVVAEYLAWGGLAAVLLHENKFPPIPNPWLLWTCLVATIALCFAPRPEGLTPLQIQFQPGPLQTMRALVFIGLIVGLWRDSTSLPARFLQLKPIVYLGKISYGLYLYHLFTFDPFDALVRHDPRFGHLPRTLALLGLTIGVASLSWHFLEKPINALKKRLTY